MRKGSDPDALRGLSARLRKCASHLLRQAGDEIHLVGLLHDREPRAAPAGRANGPGSVAGSAPGRSPGPGQRSRPRPAVVRCHAAPRRCGGAMQAHRRPWQTARTRTPPGSSTAPVRWMRPTTAVQAAIAAHRTGCGCRRTASADGAAAAWPAAGTRRAAASPDPTRLLRVRVLGARPPPRYRHHLRWHHRVPGRVRVQRPRPDRATAARSGTAGHRRTHHRPPRQTDRSPADGRRRSHRGTAARCDGPARTPPARGRAPRWRLCTGRTGLRPVMRASAVPWHGPDRVALPARPARRGCHRSCAVQRRCGVARAKRCAGSPAAGGCRTRGSRRGSRGVSVAQCPCSLAAPCTGVRSLSRAKGL